MPLDPNHQEVQDAPIIQNVDELGGPPGDYSDDANNRFFITNNADDGQQAEDLRSLRSLHPYTRPLTVSDLDSCIALENAAFNENERCSPDKQMRRARPRPLLPPRPAASTSPPRPSRPANPSRPPAPTTPSAVCCAHVVAARTRDGLATDVAMDYPRDWESIKRDEREEGHHEDGRTICVHSLAVLPEFQGSGIGRTIMMAYMQQMNGAGIADRLAIIAHGPLVPYYEKLGFVSKGPSEAQFGGGGWIDMIFDLKSIEARAMYG
ncbi:hypothetical protein VE04_02522 [Pseudogymnoascus sp. 24MN13]|nr:hypothetical protein VE04_02522 [Pseudogymnoascus sp. 24MN13]